MLITIKTSYTTMISKWFSLNPDDIILVGGLEHEFDFPYIGNVIIPTDELIFLRGVGIPPTSIYLFIYWRSPSANPS